MGTYRNITNDTLSVVNAAGLLVAVQPGEDVVGSDDIYFQTGVQGEEALWEPIDRDAKRASKNHTQTEEQRRGGPVVEEEIAPVDPPQENEGVV